MKHPHIHTHLLSCAEVYTHLCDNLDSKLETEACRKIKEHIAECEHCSALLDSMKKTVFLYKKYPTPKLSKKAKAELFAIVHIGKETSKKKSHR